MVDISERLPKNVRLRWSLYGRVNMQQDFVANNWFATLALFSWPVISIILYSTLSLSQATIWTLLGAQLLLPVDLSYKIPMVPQIDKASLPNICVLIGCTIYGRVSFWNRSRFGVTEILLITYVLSPIVTSELNGDTISFGNIGYGDRILPGVGLYDAISAAISSAIFLIPFVIGRRLLAQTAQIGELFKFLIYSQMAYTILLLFEIRFSPQLHNWVYGYSPGQFLQSIRFDGFRPMAFMGHGLQAALFLMMSIVAAAALWRSRIAAINFPSGVIFSYLSAVLILCKSIAATIYATAVAPLVLFAKPRSQTKLAVLLASIALVYPIMRTLDLFPTASMVEIAQSLSAERADSLNFRFQNENQLLAHALERPLFGWGRYGRNRVFDEDTGKDLSTTDGRWIITVGQFGIVGFVAEFGLLAIGVFRAFTALSFCRSRNDQILLSALSLIVAINLIDMLPNSGVVPWTLLLCGSLLGRSETLRAQASKLIPASRNSAQTSIVANNGDTSALRELD